MRNPTKRFKSEASTTLKLWRFSNKLISALFFSHKKPKVQRNVVHCFHHKPRNKHCISIWESTENTTMIYIAMKVHQIKWNLGRGEKYHSTHWSWSILILQLKDGVCKHKKRIMWTWQTPHADLQRLQLGIKLTAMKLGRQKLQSD